MHLRDEALLLRQDGGRRLRAGSEAGLPQQRIRPAEARIVLLQVLRERLREQTHETLGTLSRRGQH